MSQKPIKRNKNIQPLSREHHFGLLFCWKIRTGIKKNVEVNRIVKYVDYFFDTYMEQHFKTEETLLFNQVKHDMCKKAYDDHQQIKSIITSVLQGNGDTIENLRELADRVDEHIRFEERNLFPLLESLLADAQLKGIGKCLEDSHVQKPVEQYDDEFWV